MNLCFCEHEAGARVNNFNRVVRTAKIGQVVLHIGDEITRDNISLVPCK